MYVKIVSPTCDLWEEGTEGHLCSNKYINILHPPVTISWPPSPHSLPLGQCKYIALEKQVPVHWLISTQVWSAPSKLDPCSLSAQKVIRLVIANMLKEELDIINSIFSSLYTALEVVIGQWGCLWNHWAFSNRCLTIYIAIPI